MDELTGERIIPLPGDRLGLVRELANEHDAKAIQVWWRNSIMLGHLQRSVSREMAALLDAGAPARAYLAHPGDGEAWTMRALIVGPPDTAYMGGLWAFDIQLPPSYPDVPPLVKFITTGGGQVRGNIDA